MVGLGMLRPPRHTGRESSSLSTSLHDCCSTSDVRNEMLSDSI